MPLTPEANLRLVSCGPAASNSENNILDKLLSLDVGQTVHTGDTITVKLPVSGLDSPNSRIHDRGVSIFFVGSVAMTMPGTEQARFIQMRVGGFCSNIPDRQDATSLGETRLLLDAADALLEDGRDLGGSGLGIGVGACLYGADGGGSVPCLWWLGKNKMVSPTIREWWCFGLRLDPRPQSVQPSVARSRSRSNPSPNRPQLLGELGTAKQLARSDKARPPSATARGRGRAR